MNWYLSDLLASSGARSNVTIKYDELPNDAFFVYSYNHLQIICHSTTTFIAHLVNQAVAHEIVALQILMLLLEHPTDDSIEIAVGFMREVGAFLTENSPKANTIVFERFRAVLNEGNISHRVQYMIEVLMQVRKDKFKDNPILPEGLDLVEEDEQITHQIQLEEELQVQEGLSGFSSFPSASQFIH